MAVGRNQCYRFGSGAGVTVHGILIRAACTITEIPRICSRILTRINELKRGVVTDAGRGCCKIRCWCRSTPGSPRTYKTARSTSVV